MARYLESPTAVNPANWSGPSQSIGVSRRFRLSRLFAPVKNPRMRRAALVLIGVIVLGTVTFANPLDGNVLGFCPVSEGPKAIGVDAFVGLIDAVCVWLVYR